MTTYILATIAFMGAALAVQQPLFNAEFICLIAGPIIAMLVSAFKRVSFVAQYPKIVAALLSIVFSVVSGLTLHGLDWVAIATCVIVPFSTAVAAYEVVKTAGDSKTS